MDGKQLGEIIVVVLESVWICVACAYIGLHATKAMDLVEEILDISHELSTLKIKKLLDAIAGRVPHSLLPHLVFNGTWHVCFQESASLS